MLSRRVRSIGLSATLAINAKARQMKAEGIDVLDFSAGQPDFPTPPEAKEAGKQAIDADQTRYTANNGMPELRAAVADYFLREQGLTYTPEEILVSPGAKSSLYFACLALLDPGDDVLVPTPYWVSYPEQIRLAEGRMIEARVAEENGFKVTVEQLDRLRTDRTKMLLLNTPSNPTGACYTRDELAPIAEYCLRHDIWVVADEIYAKLVFDGRAFTGIAQISPQMKERTIVVNGVSKTYSMTGWRIGFAAGPREVIAGMSRLQSHTTSNATSISQWATLGAFRVEDEELRRRTEQFQRRRDETVRRLRAMPGVRCLVPEGSFYAFPNVASCFGIDPQGRRLASGADLAQYLLEHARVAVVPGDAFGATENIRISYAVELERIVEGLERMAQALAALEPARY